MILSVKGGNADKIHIYIDGEYRMTCDRSFWYSEKWHKIKEIDDKELAALESAVNSRRAFKKGMGLLLRRAYSKKEIIQKLTVSFDADTAREAAQKLEELNMIDDKNYAELYADELYNRKKFAPKRILLELKRKGIDSETAEKAVNSLDKEDFNRIILLLNSKFKNKLSDEKSVKRTVNSLLRMGYGYSDIRRAVNEVCSGADIGDDYE